MLYDTDYARKYRDRDESLQNERTYRELLDWLGGICDRFAPPIDVLDLGCGTGRYFHGLRRVGTLVGLDASAAMLEQARAPIAASRIDARSIELVEGDVITHAFAAARFDLVYSIGVLAEHVPLDARVVSNVHHWLKPGGRFAFTTVHPLSSDVPKPPQRRLAQWTLPMVPGSLGVRLHDRLMVGGMYGDERWIRRQLAGRFVIESLDRYQSDVHLHGRCVARKAAA